jgi:probable rRNA maturation factor
LKIGFHYDTVKLKLRDSNAVKKTMARIISDAGLKAGIIEVIFTSDRKVYEINSEFLGHDYYTDIITFNYIEGKTINGEIYISAERVRENAETYRTLLKTEIRRVIFHGVLHLCGYDDRTKEQKKKMSEMEEMYLALSYAE